MDQLDHMCFACGKKNPIGLKLDFFDDQGVYTTVFTPKEEHQGYPGIVHGGITATILDEVTARYVLSQGIVAFTASLNVRYRKGIPIGRPVTFKSRMVQKKGRLYEMEAQAILEDGTVAAEAVAKVMEAKNPK
ncbi:MAG: PaaI family thioesterase [Dehalobacterium sp.]|jgi:acyl-coenzyme A thioesterase PaaI-like protein